MDSYPRAAMERAMKVQEVILRAQERRGKVPMWLMVVYLSLGIWGAYYLWAYWSHY